MTVQFETLEIGQAYDRPFLARLWGYNGHQGFSRGVFTPSDAKLIVLFVTKDKAGTTTQYNDYIDGDLLYWEGEAQHGNDRRIINAQTTQTPIHLSPNPTTIAACCSALPAVYRPPLAVYFRLKRPTDGTED